MLTSERVGLRRLEVSLFARNRALHFLARRNEFNLLPVVRKQLTQVVLGYTATKMRARLGIEWMRDKYRAHGETPRF